MDIPSAEKRSLRNVGDVTEVLFKGHCKECK